MFMWHRVDEILLKSIKSVYKTKHGDLHTCRETGHSLLRWQTFHINLIFSVMNVTWLNVETKQGWYLLTILKFMVKMWKAFKGNLAELNKVLMQMKRLCKPFFQLIEPFHVLHSFHIRCIFLIIWVYQSGGGKPHEKKSFFPHSIN